MYKCTQNPILSEVAGLEMVDRRQGVVWPKHHELGREGMQACTSTWHTTIIYKHSTFYKHTCSYTTHSHPQHIRNDTAEYKYGDSAWQRRCMATT
eukprot:360166-Chlamydomonas_euryale.AAC.1